MKKFEGIKKDPALRRKINFILIGIIVIILLGIVWATFIYERSCENQSCFFYYMEKCVSASYLEQSSYATKYYSIQGLTKKGCEIEISDYPKQERYSLCYVDLGKAYMPDARLDKCEEKGS
jgi:hypothetical protein